MLVLVTDCVAVDVQLKNDHVVVVGVVSLLVVNVVELVVSVSDVLVDVVSVDVYIVVGVGVVITATKMLPAAEELSAENSANPTIVSNSNDGMIPRGLLMNSTS